MEFRGPSRILMAFSALSLTLAACDPTPSITVGNASDLPADAGAPDAGGTSSSSSSSGGATSSSSGGSSSSSSSSSGGSGEGVITLDPDTLTFFALPINSLRYAVSGYDPTRSACATIIWDYSNTGTFAGAHCNDFGPSFPYVVLSLDESGPCGRWEYAGNVEVDSAEGCVDFAGSSPVSVDLVDVDVHVTSETFTGRVVANNRDSFTPRVVTLGIHYLTDVPEDVWAQVADESGLPTWVQVFHDGEPVMMFDGCDVPICGQGGGVCGVAQPVARNITGTDYEGRIHLNWDGRVRVLDATGTCRSAVPAEAGDYTARFCVGYTVQDNVVQNPFCQEIPFTMPTDEVIWSAAMGG
ncbi:MAG: hypothetical protein AB2A00_43375 [Myxococcota bacterium]